MNEAIHASCNFEAAFKLGRQELLFGLMVWAVYL